MGAVAEAVRNLVSVGAEPPLALVDNLNFASPERPDVYWSFAETVRGGLADAARAFGLAYVSGNVSFYNETNGRPIKPTPVVAGLGRVRLKDIPGMGLEEGLLIGTVGGLTRGGNSVAPSCSRGSASEGGASPPGWTLNWSGPTPKGS